MDAKEPVEIELRINIPFPTLHDLGYFLVDLNSAVAISQRLTEGKTFYKNYIYTSRRVVSEYKNYLRVKHYKAGSLIIDISTTVIGGLILKYIDKCLKGDNSSPKSVVNVNIVQINIGPQQRELYDQLLGNTVKGDPMVDIPCLLEELRRQRLIEDHIDKQGVEYLIRTIERIRGSIIDVKA